MSGQEDTDMDMIPKQSNQGELKGAFFSPSTVCLWTSEEGTANNSRNFSASTKMLFYNKIKKRHLFIDLKRYSQSFFFKLVKKSLENYLSKKQASTK